MSRLFDEDFGRLDNVGRRGQIVWQKDVSFIGFDTTFSLLGSETEIEPEYKARVQWALENEGLIRSSCEILLKDLHENSGREYVSLEEHYFILAITADKTGFVLGFAVRKSSEYYLIWFEKDKPVKIEKKSQNVTFK